MAKDKVKKKPTKALAMSNSPKAKMQSAFISLEDKEAVKTKKAQTPYSECRAIVYFSHLPHGFEEKQLRQYLGQFGNITNLRLGRSKKTGGSKGYAFVEFKYPEVAKIVVDTMNNYLMFDRLVKCEVVPAERMSKACFKGKVNPDNPPLKVARYKAKKQVNALRTEEQNNARLKKQLRKLEKVKQKLESAGMKVDMKFDKVSKQSAMGTPLMEIDTEDSEVKMKTPRNVRKVKSRDTSNAATPLSKGGITPKMKKAAEDLVPSDVLMQKVAEKLKTNSNAEKKGTQKRLQQSLGTPKSSKKDTSKAVANSPKSAKKATPSKQPVTPKSAKKATPSKQPVTPKSGKKAFALPQMTPKSNRNSLKSPKSSGKK